MTGYVYVMDRAATGLKVGRSIEPFNRMVQLRGQGASAVLAVVSHRNEKAVERVKGEWFDVSLTEAVQAIAEAVLRVDSRPLPKVIPAPNPNDPPFRLGYLRDTPRASADEQEKWLLSSGVSHLDIWRDREIEFALKDCQPGDEFLAWSPAIFPRPRHVFRALGHRGASLVTKL